MSDAILNKKSKSANSEINKNTALDETKKKGLCSTCNFSQTCVQLKHKGQPVWYCEEFDNYVPLVSKISDRDTLPTEADTTAIAKDKLHEFKGLCLNCESREVCAFAKSESIIWQCNEYV